MAYDQALNREGDVNGSPQRQRWHDALGEKTADILQADIDCLMKQSMSTACMNAIVDAEGCYITIV